MNRGRFGGPSPCLLGNSRQLALQPSGDWPPSASRFVRLSVRIYVHSSVFFSTPFPSSPAAGAVRWLLVTLGLHEALFFFFPFGFVFVRSFLSPLSIFRFTDFVTQCCFAASPHETRSSQPLKSVLRSQMKQKPDSTRLGNYHYRMWFCVSVSEESLRIELGFDNFQLNRISSTFVNISIIRCFSLFIIVF